MVSPNYGTPAYLEADRTNSPAVHHPPPPPPPHDVAVHLAAVELALESLGVVPTSRVFHYFLSGCKGVIF